MAPRPGQKRCPVCSSRWSRVDTITRWPARAKLLFVAATAVTAVWGPLAGIALGPILFTKSVSRGGVALWGAVIVGPGLAIASFAGRRERLVWCRSCGWRGAPGELVVAERW